MLAAFLASALHVASINSCFCFANSCRNSCISAGVALSNSLTISVRDFPVDASKFTLNDSRALTRSSPDLLTLIAFSSSPARFHAKTTHELCRIDSNDG
jgi:hypothetical protein